MNPIGGGGGGNNNGSGAPVIVSAESELYMAWLTQDSKEAEWGFPGGAKGSCMEYLSVKSRKSPLLDQDDKSTTSRLSVERVTIRSGPRALASLTKSESTGRNPLQGSTALRAMDGRRAQIAMPRCSLNNQAYGKVGSLVAPRDGLFFHGAFGLLWHLSWSVTRRFVRVEHCSCVCNSVHMVNVSQATCLPWVLTKFCRLVLTLRNTVYGLFRQLVGGAGGAGGALGVK